MGLLKIKGGVKVGPTTPTYSYFLKLVLKTEKCDSRNVSVKKYVNQVTPMHDLLIIPGGAKVGATAPTDL